MKCPFCSYTENKVIDSRLSKDGEVIRRRRECNECGKRFTTYEQVEHVMPLVVKADGRREPFERARLLRGIQVSCERRPIPSSAVAHIVDEIEQELQETGEKEVDSSVIADAVLTRLSAIDDFAYLRYSARYGRYKDLASFAAELSEMIAQRRQGG